MKGLSIFDQHLHCRSRHFNVQRCQRGKGPTQVTEKKWDMGTMIGRHETAITEIFFCVMKTLGRMENEPISTAKEAGYR